MNYDVIVIGTGILGCATAYAAAKRGKKVAMFERHGKAQGASIRNFGMVWPIGQPSGVLLNRALKSKQIWLEVKEQAKFWNIQNGSIHLAYNKEELDIIEEFVENEKNNGFDIEIFTAKSTLKKSKIVNTDGLKAALWSSTEMIVDPRQVLSDLPVMLKNIYNVDIFYDHHITDIESNHITFKEKKYRFDNLFICSGEDFKTLYPEKYDGYDLVKCKLQMMRTSAEFKNDYIGASICGGLTLIHYKSFAGCNSVNILRDKLENELPYFIENGIHVMICQNGIGELIIGDSHHYGNDPSPFIDEEINKNILDYLTKMITLKDLQIKEKWYGIYPKLIDGKTEINEKVEENIRIINGVGGAGITFSFGLTEEIISEIFD